MYVGIDLEATARSKGPRMKNVRTPTLHEVREKQELSQASLRRTKSFNPPSDRLTQSTKSFGARSSAIEAKNSARSGSKSARGSSASGGGAGSGTSGFAAGAPASGATTARPASTGPTPRPASAGGLTSARLAGTSPFHSGRYSPASSRSRQSHYTPRVSMHNQTHSPSGRFHPDPVRKREIHGVDMLSNIDYYSPHGAPDNDRKMKEASWLCSQSFIESLRVYPDPRQQSPLVMPGEEIAFSGNTQSARRRHTEHLETALRRRFSIAPVDGTWMPDQLPVQWPYLKPEGEWKEVGSQLTRSGSAAGGSGLFGRLFKGGKAGTPGSRAAAAAIAAAHTSSQAGSDAEGLGSSRTLPSSRGLPSSGGGQSAGEEPKVTMKDNLFSR